MQGFLLNTYWGNQMMVEKVARAMRPLLRVLVFLTPVGDLLARIWVASIFFRSGLVKISNWDATVALFTYVYHVPFMPPYAAAVLGTACELILPILLVLGFGGRIVILIFFLYNAIAVLSYHYLWTPEGAMGLDQHINWGLLLALLMFHGSGKLSIDHWLRRRYSHHIDEDVRNRT